MNRNQINKSQKNKRNAFSAWLENNFHIAWNSLLKLIKTPMATFITVTVLAIAITLPMALQVFVNNASLAIEKTQGSIQLSLYLKSYVSDARGRELAEEINSWPDIKNTFYITPAEAKAKFESKPELSSIIENLPYNPLPGVIVLQFQKKSLNLAKATSIKKRGFDMKDVDYARLDLEWLQKIKSLINIVNKFTYALSFLLISGMILVIGNTIKLEVNGRKEEIIVTKLVGGTHNFIRRPFVYLGFWIGAISATLSMLIIKITLAYLDPAILQIAQAYSTEMNIIGLSNTQNIILIVAGAFLGWSSAWLSATKQIRLLAPN